jgi:class 3 adenylate cyclase
MPEDRCLAAILFSDIVGYTSLMDEDEREAFAYYIKTNLIVNFLSRNSMEDS